MEIARDGKGLSRVREGIDLQGGGIKSVSLLYLLMNKGQVLAQVMFK